VLTYEHDILRAEVSALQLVRAHTAAPVPEVLWFDDSCVRVGSPLFVMPFIEGESLHNVRGSLSESQQSDIDFALGRHLRAIHDIRGTAFGLLSPSATRYDTWRDAFTTLWTALLADGSRKSVALPVAYDSVREVFERAAPACDEVTESRFVCWDLWDGNVLVDPATGALNGIFDLERALWGDPLMETQFAPDECRDATLEAYGPTALDTTGGQIRRAAYSLYLHLVMSIEGAYRHYPDDFIGDWARSKLADDVEHLTALAGEL
jgi:aminoglycoside phosphotransferase (APT) family kinase protein